MVTPKTRGEECGLKNAVEDVGIIDSIEWNDCRGGGRRDGEAGLYWHIGIFNEEYDGEDLGTEEKSCIFGSFL